MRLDCLLLLWLKVTANKELQEQKEVASIHDECCRVVFTLNQASRVRFVIIESSQRTSDADDHLRDLENGNDHWIEPLGAELHGHQKVVSIHGSVHTVVHDHEEDSGRRGCHVGMPAVKKDRDVMVPVQKDERLFVNDNKECVNELSVYLMFAGRQAMWFVA